MTVKGYSLREQKKARTREKLASVAQKAFLSRGFNNVTLDEIAERADVHKRTLLRYFETKVELALCVYYDSLREFKLRLETRESDVTPIMVWEAHVVEKARTIMVSQNIKLRQMIYGDDLLEAAMLSIQSEYQAVLGRAILDEASPGSGSIARAHVMAAALIGANFSIARATILAKDFENLENRVLEVVKCVKEAFHDYSVEK